MDLGPFALIIVLDLGPFALIIVLDLGPFALIIVLGLGPFALIIVLELGPFALIINLYTRLRQFPRSRCGADLKPRQWFGQDRRFRENIRRIRGSWLENH